MFEPLNVDVKRKLRLAIIISHPIQYYVPLYQRIAKREDVVLKVFFTWHAGEGAVEDPGFKQAIAWDVPLTEGYEFERVPNISSDPGTHHFWGLRNPTLVKRVLDWLPDLVHITGWAWYSNFVALHSFYKRGIKTLFRGDSHLLDERGPRVRRQVKSALLRRVFSWPSAFLAVGRANRRYYETFGVEAERIFRCPHSIDVGRFAQPAHRYEAEAEFWRCELGIDEGRTILLFAGKFERKKRPIELMNAVRTVRVPGIVLVLVGGGELEGQIKQIASADSDRFKVLPFQNQTRMPVVYRLGDLFVLPSGFNETWGLAVNEAMACGRPVLVSNRVGCAEDVVDSSCGSVFSWDCAGDLEDKLEEMARDRGRLITMRQVAARLAWRFDIGQTVSTLMSCVEAVCKV